MFLMMDLNDAEGFSCHKDPKKTIKLAVLVVFVVKNILAPYRLQHKLLQMPHNL